MNWQKRCTFWGIGLLALGISSCGGSSLTSVGYDIRASIRIEIPRQTEIDPSVDSVQVFLFSDSTLEESVGSTGLLSLESDSILSGSINNVASGIYFLQCRSFDPAGNLISSLNSQVIPVDISQTGAQVEVTCNTNSLLLPSINVVGVPGSLVFGDVLPVVINASAPSDRTIQSVNIQNIGISVIPPTTLNECAGLQSCIISDTTVSAGNIEQMVTTIYTVVDSSGQSASQVFRIQILPAVTTPSPSPTVNFGEGVSVTVSPPFTTPTRNEDIEIVFVEQTLLPEFLNIPAVAIYPFDSTDGSVNVRGPGNYGFTSIENGNVVVSAIRAGLVVDDLIDGEILREFVNLIVFPSTFDFLSGSTVLVRDSGTGEVISSGLIP